MKRVCVRNMALGVIIIAAVGFFFKNDSYGEVTLRVVHFGQLVDNESGSTDCLACHDSVSAKGVGFQVTGHNSSGNPLGSHPIEMVYPQEWSGNEKYALPSDLAGAGLRLREGKVSCITCHDLTLQNRKYFLPVSVDNSGLCFTCHRI